jgi:hypothetical protein
VLAAGPVDADEGGELGHFFLHGDLQFHGGIAAAAFFGAVLDAGVARGLGAVLLLSKRRVA